MGGPVREPKEALASLREAVSLIRAYWSGQTVRHTGEIYQVMGARPGPIPTHEIGIWLGVLGPRALRLTGELGDGWIPSMAYVPPSQAAKSDAILPPSAASTTSAAMSRRSSKRARATMTSRSSARATTGSRSSRTSRSITVSRLSSSGACRLLLAYACSSKRSPPW